MEKNKNIYYIVHIMALDAFGRLRVSNCFTTFNYYPSLITSNSNLDIDNWVNITNGNGLSTYNIDNYVNMSISNTGDYVLRITKQPMEYQPGKSRLIYLTGVMLGESSGSDTITSRIGIFNVDNSTPTTITDGVYFQTDGTNLQWVETIQTGTITVNQSSWNVDIFDGNGPSGKTLTSSNLNTSMLFVIDQEWLGVGRVRFGFIIDGVIYYAHEFNHGTLDVQYTNTPRQRIGYQIIGTSITTEHTMRQMCSTSILEGGYFPLCPRLSISNGTNKITLASSDTKYILLSLKLQSNYTNALIKLLNLSITFSAKTGNVALYEIQLHSSNGSIGSINGSLTYNNISNSMSQYSVGNGTQTISSDGFIIYSGYVSSNTNLILSNKPEDTLLTRNICSIYDTLYLIGSCTDNNEDMFGALDFIENI